MSTNKNCSITAYCDSDWAVCPDTKSVSGYVVLMGDNSNSWKSKKQTTKSLSSAEAEYRAIRKVVGEIVWLERLLTELNLTCSLPISVFCDSQVAIHIAKNPVFHERTKHIEVDCHFVRNKLQQGLIALHYIPTENQLADVLTKAMPNIQHSKILHKLFVSFPPTT